MAPKRAMTPPNKDNSSGNSPIKVPIIVVKNGIVYKWPAACDTSIFSRTVLL